MLAAARFGIKTVLLPEQNQPDWTEVPEEVRQKLKVHFIRHISELLPLTLRGKANEPKAERAKAIRNEERE